MNYFFLIISLTIYIGISRIKRTFLNEFTFVMLPYVFIIFINNVFMKRYGFYEIEIYGMFILVLAEIAFSVGSIIQISETRFFTKKICFENLNCTYIFCIILLLTSVRFYNVVTIIQSVGLNSIYKNDYGALRVSGLLGTLFLMIRPIVAIYFCESIEKKNIWGIIVTAIYIIVNFFSMVKFHTIAIIVMIICYMGIKYKKTFFKMAPFAVAGIIGLFISSYFFQYMFRGQKLNISEFAIRHLWLYIAGGTCQINNVLSGSVGKTNVFQIIYQFIIAPFGGIIYKITGNAQYMLDSMNLYSTYYFIGNNLTSNVFSIFSEVYNSGGVVLIIIAFTFLGFVTQNAIKSLWHSRNIYQEIVCLLVVSYSMLGFFTNFFITASFLESIIVCFLFCKILECPVRFVIGRKD